MPAVKKPVKILSIDDILQADDHTTATVDCPEWGGQVEVRSLTRAEVVKAWEDSMDADRSEERRVGKECVTQCRSRWSPYH